MLFGLYRTLGFWFKPFNFFNENPAIDVLPFVHESKGRERINLN